MNPNIFGRAVAVVFGAIGVTVIYALWTAEGMDEPPLFFKVTGSLIASLFVLIGIGGIFGKGMKPAAGDPDGTSAAEQPALLAVDDLHLKLVPLETQGLDGGVDRFLFGATFKLSYHSLLR